METEARLLPTVDWNLLQEGWVPRGGQFLDRSSLLRMINQALLAADAALRGFNSWSRSRPVCLGLFWEHKSPFC